MYKNIFFKIAFPVLIFQYFANAQTYAPPVNQPGTTAMYKDSSAFINWATGCNVIRGYQDKSNISLGYASAGDSAMALGQAISTGVVSLGDGGSATCTFQYPIKNGPGNDFAVFENSFDDTFLELAFVEVSSDGINFVRFPSHSLTDTSIQTSTFGPTDATKINNLAGKYRGAYGTPFDLQELALNTNLDINAITHIKIIDVVGSINKVYASRDSYNNIVNDPWPTPFPSGGFDLDAIGVIHQNTTLGITEFNNNIDFSIYPNPANNFEAITIKTTEEIVSLCLYNFSGQILLVSKGHTLNTPKLNEGIYFIQLHSKKGSLTKKIIIY